MTEDFAHGFKEIFHCTVRGTDIADARFNAHMALDTAIADKIPRHHWKMSQMQHDIQVGEDEERNPMHYVVCDAIWIYDPESDGGKAVQIDIDPQNPDSDGIKEPELLTETTN